MDILNLGSLNIDRVLRVARIVRPGETIAAAALTEFAGGKGANQSVALARAGVAVAHAGRVGADGRWLFDKLAAEGIDTSRVRVGDGPSGQAIIQVDDAGQNAIILLGGANQQITSTDVDAALADCPADSWLLVQNETSAVDHAIRAAKQRGMRIAFNPAPFDERVPLQSLELVDLLCLNETEGAALSGRIDPDQIALTLAARFPRCDVLLTLGAAGVIQINPQGQTRFQAHAVEAVDTTAAGDTFLGYYLAGLIRGMPADRAMNVAIRAAALCVTRAGALDSIPRWDEVQAFSKVSRSFHAG
jgi:ribokinase